MSRSLVPLYSVSLIHTEESRSFTVHRTSGTVTAVGPPRGHRGSKSAPMDPGAIASPSRGDLQAELAKLQVRAQRRERVCCQPSGARPGHINAPGACPRWRMHAAAANELQPRIASSPAAAQNRPPLQLLLSRRGRDTRPPRALNAPLPRAHTQSSIQALDPADMQANVDKVRCAHRVGNRPLSARGNFATRRQQCAAVWWPCPPLRHLVPTRNAPCSWPTRSARSTASCRPA